MQFLVRNRLKLTHFELVCCHSCNFRSSCVLLKDSLNFLFIVSDSDGPVQQRLCLWITLCPIHLITFVLPMKLDPPKKCRWLERDYHAPFLVVIWSPCCLQVSKIANGVTVASVEKVSPFSNVFVYVRGGSRAEAYSQQGLAHFMSVCAPLVCPCFFCWCKEESSGVICWICISSLWGSFAMVSRSLTPKQS